MDNRLQANRTFNEEEREQALAYREMSLLETGEAFKAIQKTKEHPNFARGKHKVNFDAVNHDFRKKLWDGQLPVKITLSRGDISVQKVPKPLYVMLPRLNYFTYVLDKVKTVYDEYVSIECMDSFQEMWFESNGKPLRWEVPIGVQFDTLIGLGGENRDKSRNLPWEIQFHYKGAPDDIIKLQKVGGIIDISYIKFSYINSLKESHVLRMGSAHEILAQMKKSEEEKLFTGIQKHNYEQFWEINQLLCDKHVADMKKYSIRVFSNRYNRFVQPTHDIAQFELGQGEDQSKLSPEQLKEYKAKFQTWEQQQYDLTIGEYLLKSFPNLFTSSYDLTGEEGAKELEDTVPDMAHIVKKKKRFDIVCHGLKIDLNTPIYWLQLNMGYLDNFVYLSFHSY